MPASVPVRPKLLSVTGLLAPTFLSAKVAVAVGVTVSPARTPDSVPTLVAVAASLPSYCLPDTDTPEIDKGLAVMLALRPVGCVRV